MKKTILLLLFITSQLITAQQVAWPEITRENKPWTRWWWPGSIVTEKDLSAAMESYREAGLGGMEIAVIYGVKGYEDKFINYLSPEWMKMFMHTLGEAERLDLGIDLANASGWPFGGPWVSPGDACRNINLKTWELKGGEKLNEKIEYIQPALVRPVGVRPDITKLTDPIATNSNLQLYALDQIRFEKSIPLQILVAYSDSGQIADLTKLVSEKNDLEWVAPPGKWTLYGLFEGWHGKMAERAGPGGEGDVIDHFSGEAIDNFLSHFDTVFAGYDLESLRGYFNDSYEVDDASGQANWTNDLPVEFYKRRGYDLGLYLPALFQKDTPEMNERILQDYRQTISELILEEFTSHWTRWANRQGKSTRNQAHGSPANILDLYAASDIPETEGTEITRFKFASSAANITGKRLVSCEAATWLNEHFLSNLSDVKKAADLFFLGGINHLFYHGTCFSPQDAPWPGFLFYAAVEFTPANPLWNDFNKLNEYIARVQSFMQQGRPDNDVLFYFPVYDRYAEYGRGLLEHFDGIPASFRDTHFGVGSETMLNKGIGFDYISDNMIANTLFYEGMLQTEGNIYKTIIVPQCRYIPVETFSHLLKLANEGAIIIFYGELPENVSGFGQLEEKSAFFNSMKNGLRFSPTNNPTVMKAAYGQGMVLNGNDIEQLLRFAGSLIEPMAENGLRYIRREMPDGYTYFVVNQSEKNYSGWIPLSVKGVSAAMFDPQTGNAGTSRYRVNKNGRIDVYARILPGESAIIRTYNNQVSGSMFANYDQVAPPVTISSEWDVRFTEGGPSLPSPVSIVKPAPWTSFEGEDVKNFSGKAVYSTTFGLPKEKADAWLLDLGQVDESAKIFLNGKEVTTLIGPHYRVTISRKLLKSENNLEIHVSNLMANRIAYMDRNELPWKIFYNINMAARLKENNKNGLFDASAWKPLPSGLTGPVTLTPLRVSEDNK